MIRLPHTTVSYFFIDKVVVSYILYYKTSKKSASNDLNLFIVSWCFNDYFILAIQDI